MKTAICFFLALAVVLALSNQGRSVWQAQCQDKSVKIYVAYEGDIAYENSICN